MGPFLLPLPPSANNLTKKAPRRRGKFYPTQAYERWTQEAEIWAFEQRVIPWGGPPSFKPVHVMIEILPGAGLNMGRDGDNMAKAVQDWLVKKGYLTNDCLKYVSGTHVILRRREVSPNGKACVRVSLIADDS